MCSLYSSLHSSCDNDKEKLFSNVRELLKLVIISFILTKGKLDTIWQRLSSLGLGSKDFLGSKDLRKVLWIPETKLLKITSYQSNILITVPLHTAKQFCQSMWKMFTAVNSVKMKNTRFFFCYTVLLNFVCNLYCMCNTSDEKKMTALHYTSIYSFGETNVFTPRKTPSKLDESRDYSGGRKKN